MNHYTFAIFAHKFENIAPGTISLENQGTNDSADFTLKTRLPINRAADSMVNTILDRFDTKLIEVQLMENLDTIYIHVVF